MSADTADSVTTDRPYRAALGETAAEFDPKTFDTLASSPLFSFLSS